MRKKLTEEQKHRGFLQIKDFILHKAQPLWESQTEVIDDLVYINRDGTLLYNIDTKKWTHPYTRDGRKFVKLWHKGKWREFQVGRLVLGAWLGVPENEKEYLAHHWDWNPLNNDLDNLGWVTRSHHTRIHDVHRLPKVRIKEQ